ncbi:cytochrome P450 family protein [Cavenderia fasciculata]|uniref:Cytochrome P450 family protein n=1 Tax=Cavenderia fasciculata TaxID=261658 RepID=F4PG54_CACFS|nr:cytochrome P450 family protein [Cavenderia fasciculata]EGG24688.1 cytochrome P450 family protein [Cavenderia fasciculata]|eukprot:XP_004362539.1 cytochrome P450 family protein [Cavenderia fasciculata]
MFNIEFLICGTLFLFICGRILKGILLRNVSQFVHPIKGVMNGEDPLLGPFASLLTSNDIDIDKSPLDEHDREWVQELEDALVASQQQEKRVVCLYDECHPSPIQTPKKKKRRLRKRNQLEQQIKQQQYEYKQQQQQVKQVELKESSSLFKSSGVGPRFLMDLDLGQQHHQDVEASLSSTADTDNSFYDDDTISEVDDDDEDEEEEVEESDELTSSSIDKLQQQQEDEDEYEEITPEEELIENYKKFLEEDRMAIYYSWHLGKPIVNITSIDAIKYVLRDQSTHFERFWVSGYCPLRHSAEDFNRIFRIYSKVAGSKESLNRMFPIVKKEASMLMEWINEKQSLVFDTNKLIPDFCMSMLARLFMGGAEDAYLCVKANYFFYNKTFTDYLYHILPILRRLPTQYSKDYRKNSKYRNIYQLYAMKAYFKYLNKDGNGHQKSGSTSSSGSDNLEQEDSIINILADASYHDREGLSLEEIQMSNYILNTSTICGLISLLSSIFYMFMQFPEVQQKLRREINTILSKNGQTAKTFTFDVLSEMPYLDAVIMETARLLPPYPKLIPRYANCNERVLGYRIPIGTLINCPIVTTLRNPNIFREPNKFIPERFYDMEHDVQMIAELGWGYGTTKCIGVNMSKLLIKTTLITLLSQSKFVSSNIDQVKMTKTFSSLYPSPSIEFNVFPIVQRAEE